MSSSALYGLVLFSAAAHASWNSLVKSAGDRVLTMVTIRFTGLVLGLAALPFVDWPRSESWKWLALTAGIQFGYYALLLRSYDLGDMSVVYPLARGIAPVLTTVAAFFSLGEGLGPVQVTAIGLISFGIVVLSLGAGASDVAVGYTCATGVAVAGYSLFGALGVRTAGTVLGFQAGLEIITGSGMATYALMSRRAGLLQHARQHSVVGIFAGTMSVLGYLAFLAAAKTDFIEAIEDGIASSLKSPKDDKILRLIEHSPDNFLIPTWAGDRFTHIEITMFKGRSIEVKRELYRTIVKNLELFGVSPNDVKIILLEVSSSEVGMRGGRAACDLDIGYDIAI